jgi:hypothetical protein
MAKAVSRFAFVIAVFKIFSGDHAAQLPVAATLLNLIPELILHRVITVRISEHCK